MVLYAVYELFSMREVKDVWILAKFFFCVFILTEVKLRSIKTQNRTRPM